MIRLSDTYVVYKAGTKALSSVSLEIDDGEFVFIVGPSGAGKSTLIKLLTAEIRPSAGIVSVNGFDVTNIKKRKIPMLRRTIGVVYQDFRLIDRMNVYDNVAFSMRALGIYNNKHIKERVSYVLELVGLTKKAKRLPSELSGGEQQRTAIARALVNNPEVIVADEPTGNLDPDMSLEIMDLLVRINELGNTVIVITHEKELVDRFTKRVIFLESGIICGDCVGGYCKTLEPEAK